MRRWVICLAIYFWTQGFAFAEQVTVYAAASLTSVLQTLSEKAGEEKINLRLSFGSSSTMAKQIVQGAPADVYFSANVKWMAYLEKEGMIEDKSRVDLVGNRLVVIAPKGEGFEIFPEREYDFGGAFGGRLAIGDPDHVPAGVYARQALETLGWWDEVKDRLAPGGDVRRALALVALGECEAGIVYATDAAISDHVEIIATLPDTLVEPPVVYPMAVVKGRRSPNVDMALQFFQSDRARTVFERYGFRVLIKNNE